MRTVQRLPVLLSVFATLASPALFAQNVRITPLGARTGEFCQVDRALLFEDPTGVRILYDPGRTVAGSADPRLGAVHVVLLSHVHGDHLGDAKLAQDPDDPASACSGALKTSPTVPASNTAEIAAAKNSAVIVSADVSAFLGTKIEGLRGAPTAQCAAGNEIVVPRAQPCRANVGFGARRIVTLTAGAQGVRISAVPAQHGNGLDPAFLAEPEKTALSANGLLAPMGPAQGYVLGFTNGLVVYLSGDAGQSAEMRAVVHDFYRPNLVVINIGDIFTTGPEEAAFAVTHMIVPKAVIPSHANEVATEGGVVKPDTRTARFIELVGELPVHVPLSGRTLEFNGRAKCVAGCGAPAGSGGKPKLR
jgi:L-ascorbate metabolism protein UlaG (beta-lactamase superfamily)